MVKDGERRVAERRLKWFSEPPPFQRRNVIALAIQVHGYRHQVAPRLHNVGMMQQARSSTPSGRRYCSNRRLSFSTFPLFNFARAEIVKGALSHEGVGPLLR
jgi:hypothetical protein